MERHIQEETKRERGREREEGRRKNKRKNDICKDIMKTKHACKSKKGRTERHEDKTTLKKKNERA